MPAILGISGYDQVSSSTAAKQLKHHMNNVNRAKSITDNDMLRANNWSGIGSENVVLPLNIRNKITALTTQDQYIKAAINDITMMHTALTGISTAMQRARSIWERAQNTVSFRSEEERQSALKTAGEKGLNEVKGFFSTKDSRDGYLFGGNIDNINSIVQQASTMSATNVLNGQPTASYYQGSINYRQLNFSDGQEGSVVEPITIPVKADDLWVQNIFAALYTMQDGRPDNDNVQRWFDEGFKGLNNARMEIGMVLQQLQSMQKCYEGRRISLEESYNEIVKVPTAEAIKNFEDARIALEVCLSQTSSMRDMWDQMMKAYAN